MDITMHMDVTPAAKVSKPKEIEISTKKRVKVNHKGQIMIVFNSNEIDTKKFKPGSEVEIDIYAKIRESLKQEGTEA